MIQKGIYITFIALLLGMFSFGQVNELNIIDNELTKDFKAMIHAEAEFRFDSLAPLFEIKFLKKLVNPITFEYSLDSLAKYISITTSKDKKIKFYSWDCHSGGTWHEIVSFAQFKSEKGKIIIQRISFADPAQLVADFTDSEVYEINEIEMNKKKYYLTFAWGTHGGGNQHKIIRLFSISGDKLVNCKSCFETNKDLVIEYQRSQKVNLIFDSKNNQISYDSFESDKRITLEPVNGVFTAK